MRQVRAAWFWLLLVGCIAVCQGPQEAAAQPIDQQRHITFLEQERRKPGGQGMVLFGADVNVSCLFPSVTVGRIVGGQFKFTSVLRPPLRGLLSSSERLPRPLAAGEYAIGSVFCSGLNQESYDFDGPHAKFQVRPGEVVEIGTLSLVFKRDFIFSPNGNLTRTVKPYYPALEAELRAMAPALMAKMVRRRMVLIGPPDIRVRLK
jgi:hypothetical protein